MPLFSCFTGFGFLEFSSAPSECEKVYNALVNGYRDPRTGTMTIDVSPGTHKEAQVYAWACAIAAARVTLLRAGNELRPETSYELLTSHEEKFGMTPAPNDTVAQRRAALRAAQLGARGPRYEAVWEGLRAIYGDLLVAYRPISTGEAEAYPPNPGEVGLFLRPDAVAKNVRILTAATRSVGPIFAGPTYAESNADNATSLGDGGIYFAGQSFVGDGRRLARVRLPLSAIDPLNGNLRVSVYTAVAATLGTDDVPGELLARSRPTSAEVVTVGSSLVDFDFVGAESQVLLEAGKRYVLVLEAEGIGGGEVDWGADFTAPSAVGNAVLWNGAEWSPDISIAHCYRILTGVSMKVRYENWNRSRVETRLVAGDVLVVDQGNWGLVEKVTVLSAGGEGSERWFEAGFRRPHSAGTHATTGPVPLWSNSKRHVLVVVSAAAAVDVTMTEKTNALFRRIMRSPTTWAIVQDNLDGTVGPFRIGTMNGSPLGAVPVESITL